MPSSEEPPAKKPKLSLASLKSIKVLVGREEAEFNVSKHLIGEESGFFKTACEDRSASAKEGVVRLADINSMIFGIFMTWLITKDIEQAEDLIEVTATDTKPRFTLYCERYTQLTRCSFLATSLQATNFQNAVMGLVVTTSKSYFEETNKLLGCGIAMSGWVYKRTIPGSPLRRYILDMMLADLDSDASSNLLPVLPNGHYDAWKFEYTTELMRFCMETARNKHIERPLKPAWERSPCTYHEHPDQTEGYDCTRGRHITRRR